MNDRISQSNKSNNRDVTTVFKDHLTKLRAGSVDDAFIANYAPDAILLTSFGIFKGHSGVKAFFNRLRYEMHGARFTYKHILLSGSNALLEWSGQLKDSLICDGADTFVIKEGKIISQTAHFNPRQFIRPLAPYA